MSRSLNSTPSSFGSLFKYDSKCPTVFAIFKEEESALKALDAVREAGLVKQSFVTTFAKKAQVEAEEN